MQEPGEDPHAIVSAHGRARLHEAATVQNELQCLTSRVFILFCTLSVWSPCSRELRACLLKHVDISRPRLERQHVARHSVGKLLPNQGRSMRVEAVQAKGASHITHFVSHASLTLARAHHAPDRASGARRVEAWALRQTRSGLRSAEMRAGAL